MAQTRRERERELQEIDMYDVLVPELAEPYQQRLQKAVPFLDKHVDVSTDTGQATRRSLLGNTGLIQGENNFWSNPYNYFHPDVKVDNKVYTPDSLSRYHRGALSTGNPYSMYINPDPLTRKNQKADMRAGEILAHEGTHAGQIIYNNRTMRQNLVDSRVGGQDDIPFGWIPNFTSEFIKDLMTTNNKQKEGYGGLGFGQDPMETMAYLSGFEAEMGKGQNLKQHPVFGSVFSRHPGMYDEYTKSITKIRKYLKK